MDYMSIYELSPASGSVGVRNRCLGTREHLEDYLHLRDPFHAIELLLIQIDKEPGRTLTSRRYRSNPASRRSDVDVAVDNKTVTFHPPAQLTYEIETSELDGSVRSDKGTLDLALSWEPDE